MSTIFLTGDVVLWNVGGPSFPGYVGIVEEVYEDQVFVRFWHNNSRRFSSSVEGHDTSFLTKIGNVNDWERGIF